MKFQASFLENHINISTKECNWLDKKATRVFENFVACGTLEEVEHAKEMVECMKELRRQ